jgi:hypothetical protein
MQGTKTLAKANELDFISDKDFVNDYKKNVCKCSFTLSGLDMAG